MLVFDVLLMTNLWQFRFQFILSISSWFSSICQQHFIHCLGFLNFYEWHLRVSFRCQNFAFDIMCNVWCVVSVFARTFHWKCVNCILFIIANNTCVDNWCQHYKYCTVLPSDCCHPPALYLNKKPTQNPPNDKVNISISTNKQT